MKGERVHVPVLVISYAIIHGDTPKREEAVSRHLDTQHYFDPPALSWGGWDHRTPKCLHVPGLIRIRKPEGTLPDDGRLRVAVKFEGIGTGLNEAIRRA